MNEALEALNSIRKAIEEAYHFPLNLTPEYGIVKHALKRNEPMKPSLADCGYYVCQCSMRVNDHDNFCKQCGQALDWSK